MSSIDPRCRILRHTLTSTTRPTLLEYLLTLPYYRLMQSDRQFYARCRQYKPLDRFNINRIGADPNIRSIRRPTAAAVATVATRPPSACPVILP
jgi:hypothetical protein